MDISVPSAGEALLIAADGRVDLERPWDPDRPTAILPGAFNPAHAGHWGLAAVAAELLGLPVSFELSIANVDKPSLALAEVEQRKSQFAGRAPLWLTHAPQFVHKAELFPAAVFVVGADTALRIVDCRYYQGDAGQMHAALQRLREQRCRFLVACRVHEGARCLSLADVPVPQGLRDLFDDIPPERFRLDVSSTEVRARIGE